MKRFISTLILVLVSSTAFALPAPKDIEAAVNAGQMPKAESMLREVIQEKPNSAKAHYELGQVLARQGRNIEAREELLSAQRIDPTLKFARDPQHFRDLLEKLPAGVLKVPSLSQSGAAFASPPPQTPLMTYILVGAGLLILVVVVARRFAPRAAPAMATAGGYAASGAPGMPGYAAAPGYGPGYPNQPASGGMGMGGAVLGGVAGLAAGYGLAKAFEHNGDGSRPHAADNSGFAPIDSPAAPQQDFGAFDAGAGDDWDAGDAGSGDDNNW